MAQHLRHPQLRPSDSRSTHADRATSSRDQDETPRHGTTQNVASTQDEPVGRNCPKKEAIMTPDEPCNRGKGVANVQKCGNNPKDRITSRGGTNHPDIGPQCTYCNYRGCGTTRKDQEEGCPASSKTCTRCMKPGHFRAVCRSIARAYATSNEDPDYEKVNPAVVGTTPTHGPPQSRRRGHRRSYNQLQEIEPQLDQAAIPHMENVMQLRLQPTKMPTRTREGQNIKVATMPGTEQSLCLVGRCLAAWMAISTQDLMETTEKLMAANGNFFCWTAPCSSP